MELTAAIQAKDMEAATTAKSAVENAQRELRQKRETSGETYTPRFFEVKGDHWEPKFKCVCAVLLYLSTMTDEAGRLPDNPDEALVAVREWIYPSSPAAPPAS